MSESTIGPEGRAYLDVGPSSARGYLRRAIVVAIGLAFGSSAFFSGFYDATVWEPILLGSIAILIAFMVARPSVPTGPAAVTLGGLLAMWIWSLLSGSWTEAPDLAVTDANRWLFYAVALVLLLFLASDSVYRKWLIGAATAGVLMLAAYVIVRFLAGQGAGLFVANRLDGPLGYINGVASYMLVGFWPLIAVAERARQPAIRGLAVFAAVQLISVAFLTQSRGAMLALVGSAAVVLIVAPGRLTRVWSLAVVMTGVGVAFPWLRDVVDSGGIGPAAGTLQGAACATLAGGLGAGTVWALACNAVDTGTRRSASFGRSMRRVSVLGITAITVVVAGIALSDPGQRIDQVRNQYETFTSLQPAEGPSRLVSGGGNRYDYWRVAYRQFENHPLSGVGAGNYNETYYLERRTTEDIQQAHSLEMQTLGELGLVGAFALAAFLGAVSVGIWRTARLTRSGVADPAIAVAAGGTFLIWLVHTSVDWMHLIPGLTGIALCATATLLPPLKPLRKQSSVVVVVFVVLAASAASYPVARQYLSLRFQSQASDKLSSDPLAALEDAQDSLALEPAQRTYYLESAAFARLGLYRPAMNALLTASRRVPHDFVALGLLGDLATRRGLEAPARRFYGRASRLNPLDPGLKALANDDGQ